MPDHDAFAERERAFEEEYFHRKERALIDMMRRASAVDQTRRELIARTGLEDPEMLRELEELGFTPETVGLLPIMPVVEMAWASGSVTDAERKLVIELARSRGIHEGSVADTQLAKWLAERPSIDVFIRARHLVRAVLTVEGHTEGALTAAELVKYCEAVASASGGMLGIHRISADERALLTTIAAEFNKQNRP
jgi:hypothetical protein